MTKNEVLLWLDANCDFNGDVIVNDDLTVDVAGTVQLHSDVAEINVKFGTVTTFTIHKNPFITTLQGVPAHCETLICTACPRLSSLDGLHYCRNFDSYDLNLLDKQAFLALPPSIEWLKYVVTGYTPYPKFLIPELPLLRSIQLPDLVKPSADVMRFLLKHKVVITKDLNLSDKAEDVAWLVMLAQYRGNEDHLAMLTEFEMLFGEAFTQDSLAPASVPHGDLTTEIGL